MELDQSSYLRLDRTRTWSETFAASFALLRLTYRTLIRTIFRLAGPWLAISFLCAIGFVVAFAANLGPVGNAEERIPEFARRDPQTFLTLVLVGILLYLVVVGILIYVVAIAQSYYRGYHEERSVPTVTRTKQRAAQLYKKLVKLAVVAFGLYMGLVVVLLLGVAILGIPIPILEVIVQLVWIGVYLPLLAVNLVAPGVLANEDGPLKNLLPRVFALLRGRWWRTIGLGFVQSMMASVAIIFVVVVIAVMVGILTVMSGDDPAGAGAVAGVLLGLVSVALLVVSIAVPALHQQCLGVVTYFTIREEVDGGSLQERIDTIGAGDVATDADDR